MKNIGKGYFAFDEISELPITFIKMDMHLVNKWGNQKILIPYLVNEARDQGWNVIISGIETEEQFSRLRGWQEI
ncbi:EAL domain-containing protein [Virgibacillus siamensis]|uniref:EAL domain-containing protein n=1 Tax=Virgibacillus siamensis TaxID=480071 RepID=UPI00363172D8